MSKKHHVDRLFISNLPAETFSWEEPQCPYCWNTMPGDNHGPGPHACPECGKLFVYNLDDFRVYAVRSPADFQLLWRWINQDRLSTATWLGEIRHHLKAGMSKDRLRLYIKGQIIV